MTSEQLVHIVSWLAKLDEHGPALCIANWLAKLNELWNIVVCCFFGISLYSNALNSSSSTDYINIHLIISNFSEQFNLLIIFIIRIFHCLHCHIFVFISRISYTWLYLSNCWIFAFSLISRATTYLITLIATAIYYHYCLLYNWYSDKKPIFN